MNEHAALHQDDARSGGDEGAVLVVEILVDVGAVEDAVELRGFVVDFSAGVGVVQIVGIAGGEARTIAGLGRGAAFVVGRGVGIVADLGGLGPGLPEKAH